MTGSARAGTPVLAMRLALAGSLLLVIAGLIAFALASRTAHQAPAGDAITVTVTAKACQPDSLTVPAGKPSFAIVNGSDRVLEWEILDGVMVVAERENITPGMTATLNPRLEAGHYAITCGLLSNPHGTLIVTPSAEAERTAPSTLVALIGPLAEMKVDLAIGAQAFTQAAESLTDAIKAGDLDLAQARYPAATAAYRGIEANARRFGDLHAAIAATATYYAKGPADPAFSGLHRIEYGLFSQRSLDGLAPIADRLVTDSKTLGKRLSALKPAPDMLAGNAAAYLAALGHAIPSGEELYAQTELGDLDAALAATARTVALVRPVGQRTDAALMKDIEDRLKAARDAVGALRGPQGYPSYDTVSADTRAALSGDFAALGESLAALDTKLGLQ